LQFTPDLVPSDIVGTRIYRQSGERFDTELGPIFANFVLADEINRAPAKVQSALLEVMAERQVTIGGVRYPVPAPFLVLATQNPIESEGVYPLPEAQRDRFLMKIVVDYPTAAEEREIIYRMGGEPPVANPVITTDELARLQVTASRVFVHHAIVDYVVRLVLATRTPAQHGMPDCAQWVSYGASPRASLGLIAAGRAIALLRGRDYVLPQDVLDVATGRVAASLWSCHTTRSPTASPRFTRCAASCRRSRCLRSRPVSGPRGPSPATDRVAPGSALRERAFLGERCRA
jgi:MoxR-like ATPase